MTPPNHAIVLGNRNDDRLAGRGLVDVVAAQVARKWAASFGICDGAAMLRLEAALVGMARSTLIARDDLVDFEGALDEAAHLLTAGWLEVVVGEPIAASAQKVSAARLAFLMVNADGAWSDRFLDPAAPLADLRAAMEAVYFVATPPVAQREIERQSL